MLRQHDEKGAVTGYTPSPSQGQTRQSMLSPVLVLIIGLFLILVALFIVSHPPGRKPVPEIDRLIRTMASANEEALDRSLQVFHHRFQEYKFGISAFTDDMSSLGTRLKLVQLLGGDWWRKWWHDEEMVRAVDKYVGAKFEKHVLSEKKLRAAIEESLATYRWELEANRNKLLLGVREIIVSEKLPVGSEWPEDGNFSKFQEVLRRRMDDLVKGMAETDLLAWILAESGGALAGYATTQILTSVGASVLAAAVAQLISVGTGAKLAAVFGSTGSITGPFGTIVGVAAGLTAGLLVDWWVSDLYSEKLREDIGAYLERVEHEVIEGTQSAGASNSRESWKGLRRTLRDANDLMEKAARQALTEKLRG